MWRTVLQAIRNGIVHPVPLPIIAGLLFAQTGLVVPEVVLLLGKVQVTLVRAASLETARVLAQLKLMEML